MNNIHSSLGENIRKALKRVGKKQKDLAEHCGVDKSHVSKWCNNINKPNSRYLNMIAKYTGLNVEELQSGKFQETEKQNNNEFINHYIDQEIDSIMNFVKLFLEEGIEPTNKKVDFLRTKIESLVRLHT